MCVGLVLLVQVRKVLSGVDDWQWDAFSMEEATGGRPLSFLAFHLINRAGLIKGLNLNAKRLARWAVCDGVGSVSGVGSV